MFVSFFIELWSFGTGILVFLLPLLFVFIFVTVALGRLHSLSSQRQVSVHSIPCCLPYSDIQLCSTPLTSLNASVSWFLWMFWHSECVNRDWTSFFEILESRLFVSREA